MSLRLSPLSVSVCSALVFIASCFAHSQVAVTTWHYNNGRTGANTNETKLDTGNVKSGSFGKLFAQPVDGAIIGQALYLPHVTIPGAGTHNVVYVATMHNSVYAFDADDTNGANASPLWQTSFLTKGVKTIPITMQGCGTVTGWQEVGILSTPVIDPVARKLYVVAKTYEKGAAVHRLHSLNVATGKETPGSPVVITASFNSAGKTDVFQDAMQVNRPALLLEKGNIYIAFGSNGCRSSKEKGWVIAYKASTLKKVGVFDTEPGMSAAGIWMRGGGLSSDSEGNIYGETADGPYKDGTNFGLTVFKLTGKNVSLADWFTPFDMSGLNRKDQDLDEPTLILPDQPGPYRHLALAVGKEGTLYVLNRDDMGHFCSNCRLSDTQIVQELPMLVGAHTGALIYWNDTVYSSAVSSSINAYALAGGLLAGEPFAQSQQAAGQHSPVISANGNTSGVLWQINGSILTAYDALTLKRLYTSSQNKSRDALPDLPHFANLMVVNGKVYIGTNSTLEVYGLL